MGGPLLRRTLLLLGTVVGAAFWLNSINPAGAIHVGRSLGEVRAQLTDGAALRLEEERGEVVVLSFWATWCEPCRQEARTLSRLHHEGVRVFGLAVDPLPLASVADKARAIGIDYPVGQAAPELYRRLGISMLPTTCVIGRDGLVRTAEEGVMPYEDLRAAVDAAGR